MYKIFTITPSWLIEKKNDFYLGIRNLNAFGFNIINKNFKTHLLSPKQKANQIHFAFKNKNIDIILSERGGFSSIKVLPYINFRLIKQNPKIFAGFSDISTLLNSIYENTGIITLHSPMLINFSNPSQFTIKSFLNAINGFKEKNLFKNVSIKVYKHGVSNGILKGGNLITLTSLIGTPWEIDTNNCILFIEEVDEKLHSIDRCLTQWILKGKLNNISGLILGNFRGINTDSVYNIISKQLKISFPVVYCPFIGHIKNKITLPIGAKVKLNTARDTLEIISIGKPF